MPRIVPHLAPALWTCLSAILLTSACAGVAPREFSLSQSLRAEEDDEAFSALVEDFYAGSLSLEAFRHAIATFPQRTQETSVARELLAYAALLDGDSDGAWRYFMEALEDPNAPLAELYLEEAVSQPRTAAQREATAQFLDELRRKHPSPQLRARAAYHLADELAILGRLDDINVVRQQIGWIDSWLMAGSFDNDQGKGFFATYAPEQHVDVAQLMTGTRLPVAWRSVALRTQAGMLPLGWALSPSDHAAAYLVTWVHSDQEQTAELRMTGRAGLRAWCNENLVISEERIDHVVFDNVRAQIHLERGWNQLLVKSATNTGPWKLGARLTDAQGVPLEDLTFSDEPQRQVSVVQAQTVGLGRPTFPAVDSLKQGARRDFVHGRSLHLWGQVRPAVDALQRMVETHPHSMLGVHFAAAALWNDDEQGRALDLINRALRSEGNTPGRLLMQRAGFYAEKGLLDKAQADLLKMRKEGGKSREATIELASVLARRGFQIDSCRLLDEALEQWPDDGWTTRESGHCWEKRGYRRRALERYLRSRELEPGQLWGLDKLREDALDKDDLREALRLSRLRQRLAPERLSYLLEEGDVLRWAGERSAARGLYAAAASASPDWSRPRELLGQLDRELGNEAAALEHLHAAYERDPDNARLADLLDYLEPQGSGLAERYAPSEEDIARAVANASNIARLPGAQVLMLLDDEVTEVNQEGSAKRIVTHVSLALNKQGADDLIRASIPTSGKQRILQAYSIKPNGERQEASSIRHGTVRFRSLEVGSIVVLQYVHYARPQSFLPNHYVGDWYFQGVARQSERSRWVLVLPEDRHLSVSVQGQVASREERADGQLVRIFEATSVPPLLPERLMPSPRDLLWRASVSTVEGWEEYVRWERALLSQVFRLDSETSSLAKRLTAGAESTREKFDRLYHFVAQEIRYQQDYENTIAGVRPHACPVVVSRGYGDCKDKAVLLILLAKQVGIDVDFAILRTTDAGKVQREIPNQQFNHAIVYVPEQPGIPAGFFMDPTTDGLDMGNLRADDQGAWSLVLDPDSGTHRFLEIPYAPPTMERSVYRFSVEVQAPEEASAQFALETRGSGAASVRQLLRNPEQAKKLHQGLATRLFPGATVTGVQASEAEDIWNPLRLTLDLNVGAALQRQGDDVRLPVPELFPLGGTTTLQERAHPMRLGPPDSYESVTEVRIPPGGKVTHLPQQVEVSDPCFTLTRHTHRSERVITVKTEYVRTCAEIQTDEYVRYRSAVQRAQSQLADPLLFRLPPAKLAGHHLENGH